MDTDKNKSVEAGNGILGHVPQSLKEKLSSQVPLDTVEAVAQHDLDGRGMYCENYLVLAKRKLGHFAKSGDSWDGRWTDIGDISSAAIIDGLGANCLRIIKGESVLAEYRFTLRYAKDIAKLHRRMEKQIEGKADTDPADEAPTADEKKVRCDKCGHVIPAWAETCPSCLSRRKVLSRLLDFVKPYKWRAIIGFILALLVMFSQLIRPYLTKPMLDNGLGLGGDNPADYMLLLQYIWILGGAMVFAAVAGAYRERLMARLGSTVSRDIRDKTYEHLHKLSLSFFSKKPTGSLVTRITSDSDRIWDFVAFTLVEAVISVLTLVGVGVMLFVLNWKLACIVLLPIPAMFFLTVYFHKKMHGGHDRLFHKWSLLTAVVADALPGVRVIKAFSQEKREVNRFTEKNSQFYEDEVGMITLWTLFGPVMQFCSQVGNLLVWIVGGYWVVTGKLSAGTLVAFNGFMWMFYGPIHTIAHMDRMLNRAATSVQRIFEVLDTQPVIYSRAVAKPVDALQGKIEFRNVSFAYDGIRKVLKNVNLTINPGEMIGLAGTSGGGKTTMINLVCRMYDVLEGQILIDGIDVREYDVETLRRKIGLVLQEPFLFHGTVGRNIAYGRPEATAQEVITAARAANAHDFIVGFPDGYDTIVGERGHTLSGGERQRISIARAILSDPAILILDEATSSVDTETEKLIQEALDRLVANRTTIAIAHRLSTLRKADRLVILEKGQITEQGTHEELSTKEDGLYAKLLRMQTEMQSIIAIK
ncbi:MAG: ABC transporter ATP-binding protein [Planctomycetaceae bacterium]|nr:MAG: ABC transporter ATP-binding protein [Planctomycetaceae bacterium]